MTVLMSHTVISDSTYFRPLSNQTHVTVPTSHFLLKSNNEFGHTVESVVLMSSCREEGFLFMTDVEGNVLNHAHVAM